MSDGSEGSPVLVELILLSRFDTPLRFGVLAAARRLGGRIVAPALVMAEVDCRPPRKSRARTCSTARYSRRAREQTSEAYAVAGLVEMARVDRVNECVRA